MESKTSRIHPLIAVAAVSVTLFSLAGVAVLTGVMPGSKAEQTQPNAALPAPTTVAPLAANAPAATEPAPVVPAPAARPAPAAPTEGKVVHKSSPQKIAAKETPVMPMPAAQTPAATVPPPPPAPVCHNCGAVESIRQITQEGQGTGLGAIAGGVLGGVLGHQVGGGRGKDVATVLGAAGGAYAGHQVEKSQRKSVTYDVTVRLDDGTRQTVQFKEQPAWREGDRVKVVDGTLVSAGQQY